MRQHTFPFFHPLKLEHVLIFQRIEMLCFYFSSCCYILEKQKIQLFIEDTKQNAIWL